MALASPSPIAQEWQLSAAVTATALSPDDATLAVATADGQLWFFAVDDLQQPPQSVQAHQNGVSLQLQADLWADSFLSAGDDGCLQRVSRNGAVTLATHKGAWLEHVLPAPTLGQIFYTVKKQVYRLDNAGKSLGEPWEHPATVTGLALDNKERRLAASHYNGVTLWWTKAKETLPEVLTWKGSHTGVLWHPKEQIVVTTMQEPVLHGWRISDKAEMRMTGYETKVESLAFVEGGKYLASTGSAAVICWPFFAGGPWGKQPLFVGPDTGGMATLLKNHPLDPLLAVAYDNGAVALVPLFQEGSLKLLDARPATVSSMCWTSSGDKLFAADSDGKLFLFTVDSVSAAYRV